MARSLVERRVRYWQKKLRLSDWTITVVAGPTDDGTRANCAALPEYKEATITIDPDVVPAEEVDSYAVHELLHCLTWRLEVLAEGFENYEFAREVAETTVTDLEKIILHLGKRV